MRKDKEKMVAVSWRIPLWQYKALHELVHRLRMKAANGLATRTSVEAEAREALRFYLRDREELLRKEALLMGKEGAPTEKKDNPTDPPA